mgnify:CR=1 FL=1
MNEMDAAREDHPIKRTIADSVFTNLFGNRKYLLQFYQALHPDDTDIKEDDLSVITIENVLTDGQYNDLGATVRSDKMIFLCEAQSTWSLNVLIRLLMYLAEHEKEVVNIMGTLFGAEEISRIHDVNVRQEGLVEGIQRGRIQQYIEDCKEFNQSKDDVAMRVSMKFNLSDDAARDAINEYWK